MTSNSFKPEVIADGSGKWVGNDLRFATEAEAEQNVADLRARWTLVTETRVVPSEDPVNHRWDPDLGLQSADDAERQRAS